MGPTKEALKKKAIPAHRHHDIAAETWKVRGRHLPGREGVGGDLARDTRLVINAVFWILRTGAPWRDVPPALGGLAHYAAPVYPLAGYGGMGNPAGRSDGRTGLRLADARRQPWQGSPPCGHQEMGRTKGGSTPRDLWPWMRMGCQSASLGHKVPQQIGRRLAA
jgi:hypothetical protein